MLPAAAPADLPDMASPLVHCDSCEREWHSATMADGLRQMDGCPRCGGTLVFSEEQAPDLRVERRPSGDAARAPHRVLGVPRR